MSDRKQVVVFFNDVEKYLAGKEEIEDILKKDTGAEDLLMSRAIPPQYFGLNLTNGAIETLKGYDWVIVHIADE
ncbi:hypothetical protein BJX61DRAFT_539986 [Aspergillus egyptiacus]|nr:hypothetical protein BJX61DRAFT_539986 [Aspergillus egyptiacus]